MMWDASEGMGWWMVFGSVFWIIIVGVVVYAFTRAFEGSGQSSALPQARAPETPIEIAKRRYAAGEISDDEFMRIRDTLAR